MRRKSIFWLVLITFISNIALPYGAQAQTLNLPAPTQLLATSQNYSFPVLRGLKLDSQNPLNIQFIIDPGSQKTVNKDDAGLLVKYFLAALTIPKENLWVNLSPYEANRIIPNALSTTELGEDMLGQDYLLKQLASSMTYPETTQGKQYWDALRGSQISALQGRPLGTNFKSENQNFNKIWISANKAQVYEGKNLVLITKSSLKASMEQDNPAFKQNILPMVEAEVNHGKNFAQLRQIYNAVILGLWFKTKFQDSFYKSYLNKETTNGIATANKASKDKIYALYCEAFKQGVYNYTKTDTTQFKRTRRQYFSGGVNPTPDKLETATDADIDPMLANEVVVAPTSISVNGLGGAENVDHSTALSAAADQLYNTPGVEISDDLQNPGKLIVKDLNITPVLQKIVDKFGQEGVALIYTYAHYMGLEGAADKSELPGWYQRYQTAGPNDESREILKAKIYRNENGRSASQQAEQFLKKRYLPEIRTAWAGIPTQERHWPSLTTEQEDALWFEHFYSPGWHALTDGEQATYNACKRFFKGVDISITINDRQYKLSQVHIVHTGQLAVTNCEDYKIRSMVKSLQKPGRFNAEQINWLMSQGWLGNRVTAAMLAATIGFAGATAGAQTYQDFKQWRHDAGEANKEQPAGGVVKDSSYYELMGKIVKYGENKNLRDAAANALTHNRDWSRAAQEAAMFSDIIFWKSSVEEILQYFGDYLDRRWLFNDTILGPNADHTDEVQEGILCALALHMDDQRIRALVMRAITGNTSEKIKEIALHVLTGEGLTTNLGSFYPKVNYKLTPKEIDEYLKSPNKKIREAAMVNLFKGDRTNTENAQILEAYESWKDILQSNRWLESLVKWQNGVREGADKAQSIIAQLCFDSSEWTRKLAFNNLDESQWQRTDILALARKYFMEQESLTKDSQLTIQAARILYKNNPEGFIKDVFANRSDPKYLAGISNEALAIYAAIRNNKKESIPQNSDSIPALLLYLQSEQTDFGTMIAVDTLGDVGTKEVMPILAALAYDVKAKNHEGLADAAKDAFFKIGNRTNSNPGYEWAKLHLENHKAAYSALAAALLAAGYKGWTVYKRQKKEKDTIAAKEKSIARSRAIIDGAGENNLFIKQHITFLDKRKRMIAEDAAKYQMYPESVSTGVDEKLKDEKQELSRQFAKIKSDNKDYFDSLKRAFSGFSEDTLIAIWCAHSLPGGWRELSGSELAAFSLAEKPIIVEGKPRTARKMYTNKIGVTTCTQDEIDAKEYYMSQYSTIGEAQTQEMMDNGWLGDGKTTGNVDATAVRSRKDIAQEITEIEGMAAKGLIGKKTTSKDPAAIVAGLEPFWAQKLLLDQLALALSENDLKSPQSRAASLAISIRLLWKLGPQRELIDHYHELTNISQGPRPNFIAHSVKVYAICALADLGAQNKNAALYLVESSKKHYLWSEDHPVKSLLRHFGATIEEPTTSANAVAAVNERGLALFAEDKMRAEEFQRCNESTAALRGYHEVLLAEKRRDFTSGRFVSLKYEKPELDSYFLKKVASNRLRFEIIGDTIRGLDKTAILELVRTTGDIRLLPLLKALPNFKKTIQVPTGESRDALYTEPDTITEESTTTLGTFGAFLYGAGTGKTVSPGTTLSGPTVVPNPRAGEVSHVKRPTYRDEPNPDYDPTIDNAIASLREKTHKIETIVDQLCKISNLPTPREVKESADQAMRYFDTSKKTNQHVEDLYRLAVRIYEQKESTGQSTPIRVNAAGIAIPGLSKSCVLPDIGQVEFYADWDKGAADGGVTWKDAGVEKAENSQNFTFEKIPSIGEIRSVGFKVLSLEPTTIGQLISF